jgi:hypothetical protein
MLQSYEGQRKTGMPSTFLSRLQGRARYAIIGALVLIIGVPLYQFLILAPSGYGNSATTAVQLLNWIHTHVALFLGYRALLIVGVALLIGLPFTLFRIIVAQEVLGQDEGEAGEDEEVEEEDQAGQAATDGMPSFAWRGRGFAVLAAWLGISGLAFFPLAALASTLYLLLAVPSSAPLTGLFDILTFTVGGGLIGLSCLFFGAVITRRGRHLWPDSWIVFGYIALAIALLLCGSAVEVAFAPGTGQAVLTTPAILFFALWTLWFGIMVVRLKPE